MSPRCIRLCSAARRFHSCHRSAPRTHRGYIDRHRRTHRSLPTHIGRYRCAPELHSYRRVGPRFHRGDTNRPRCTHPRHPRYTRSYRCVHVHHRPHTPRSLRHRLHKPGHRCRRKRTTPARCTPLCMFAHALRMRRRRTRFLGRRRGIHPRRRTRSSPPSGSRHRSRVTGFHKSHSARLPSRRGYTGGWSDRCNCSCPWRPQCPWHRPGHRPLR